MEAEPAAIRAEHLCKRFGATAAVHDVSFEVARGEVVGFLGPNGAGKSTTLRMLTGVFPPTSGHASIAGHDVVRDALAARQSLGYLPERAALYGDMNVAAYLAFVAEMKRVAAREVSAAVARAMGATGIEHVSHRLVGALSKGYRQRVGIAQALLGEPPVLILDEPTSGLDPEQVAEIRSLIRELGAERTVILSTHVLSEVETVCSRVMIMHRGRILAVDEPRRLERRLKPHRELLTRIVGPEPDVLAMLRALPSVAQAVLADPAVDAAEAEALDEGVRVVVRCKPDCDARRDVAAAVVDRGFGLLEMRPRRMTLEEIFLALVGEGESGASGAASSSGTAGSSRTAATARG